MKQFFFAGSFALAAILSYGWINADATTGNQYTLVSSQSFTDTTPKKKDSMKRKHPGKDSMNRKDTSGPKRDSSGQ